MKRSNIQWRVSKFIAKKFFRLTPAGINLIKLFGVSLLALFCKLDHFTNISNLKRSLRKKSKQIYAQKVLKDQLLGLVLQNFLQP